MTPWNDARETCVKMGGDLVSIHTAAQNNKVLNFVQKEDPNATVVWTGLNSLGEEVSWVCRPSRFVPSA